MSVGSIWLRLSFYLLGSLAATITVDPKDPNLFGAGGTNASPFVLAYRNAQLEPLAHIINAVILISVLSNGSITIYSSSRHLLDSVIVGGGLAFLNVSNGGAEVFNWLSNLISLFSCLAGE
ncbi:hypothetical protein EDB80DRAFT_871720 [Ilyonectria destructans]|nr:hypothetical protein EDB80DRAFT_871720 [Ilyonectria destructans]